MSYRKFTGQTEAKCNACKSTKPIESFRLRNSPEKLWGKCDECRKVESRKRTASLTQQDLTKRAEWSKRWRERLPNDARKALFRKESLKRYGISPADYDRMLAAQDGRCAICGSQPSGGKNLHVDHCHGSGTVRGLLCSKCNTAIGLMDESADRMYAAVTYLSLRKAEAA
jgi:hypothetical protein